MACNNLHLVDTGTIPILARRVFDYHRNNPPNKPVVPSKIPVNISVTVPPNGLINYPPVAPPIPSPFAAPILETCNLLSSVIKINLASLANLVVQRLLPSVQDSAMQAPPEVLLMQQHNGSASYNYLPPNFVRLDHSIQDGIGASTDISLNVISLIVQPLTILSGLANPSAMLPAIPAKVREQIKQSEFVHFNLLVPSSAPLTNDDYTIKIGLMHRVRSHS